MEKLLVVSAAIIAVAAATGFEVRNTHPIITYVRRRRGEDHQPAALHTTQARRAGVGQLFRRV